MADHVHAHGRRMSRLLEQALDAVPSEDIPTFIRALDDRSPNASRLGDIFNALAIELHLVALRRQMDRDACDAIARATTEAMLPPDTPDDVA